MVLNLQRMYLLFSSLSHSPFHHSNAVALKNLARLSFSLGNDEYMKKAQATVQAFQVPLTKYPFALPAFVSSFILVVHGSKEVRALLMSIHVLTTFYRLFWLVNLMRNYKNSYR